MDRWESFRPPVDLRGALAAVSFWSGIALPGLYLPLLFHGIEGPVAFLGLFGLHVLALVGGRCHRRGPDE